MGPRQLPAERGRDPGLSRSADRTGPQGHRVRAGTGARLRADPTRQHEGRRGRDAAGRGARASQHSAERGRLLRAWRQVPAAGLGPYVGHHGEGGGRAARHHVRAAVPGQAGAGDRRCAAHGRRR